MLPMQLSFRTLLAPLLEILSAFSVSCKCLFQIFLVFGIGHGIHFIFTVANELR